MKATGPKPQSEIHRLLFMTVKQAHIGAEAWLIKIKAGVTPLQYGVLRSISPKGSTLGEVARYMMLKPPSILPTIGLLEEQGYITRRSDARDRRKIPITLTPKGKRLIQKVMSTRKPDPLSIAFKKISPPKQKQLISLLVELQAAIPKK